MYGQHYRRYIKKRQLALSVRRAREREDNRAGSIYGTRSQTRKRMRPFERADTRLWLGCLSAVAAAGKRSSRGKKSFDRDSCGQFIRVG